MSLTGLRGQGNTAGKDGEGGRLRLCQHACAHAPQEDVLEITSEEKGRTGLNLKEKSDIQDHKDNLKVTHIAA